MKEKTLYEKRKVFEEYYLNVYCYPEEDVKKFIKEILKIIEFYPVEFILEAETPEEVENLKWELMNKIKQKAGRGLIEDE